MGNERYIEYNGRNIAIKMGRSSEYIEELREYYDNYIEESETEEGHRIFRLHDDEGRPSGSVGQIETEFKEFAQIINNLDSDEEMIKQLNLLPTKKNNRFRKKGYNILKSTKSATMVENEFTPSWGMLVLRIQALSEDEVEVYFKYEYLQ